MRDGARAAHAARRFAQLSIRTHWVHIRRLVVAPDGHPLAVRRELDVAEPLAGVLGVRTDLQRVRVHDQQRALQLVGARALVTPAPHAAAQPHRDRRPVRRHVHASCHLRQVGRRHQQVPLHVPHAHAAVVPTRDHQLLAHRVARHAPQLVVAVAIHQQRGCVERGLIHRLPAARQQRRHPGVLQVQLPDLRPLRAHQQPVSTAVQANRSHPQPGRGHPRRHGGEPDLGHGAQVGPPQPHRGVRATAHQHAQTRRRMRVQRVHGRARMRRHLLLGLPPHPRHQSAVAGAGHDATRGLHEAGTGDCLGRAGAQQTLLPGGARGCQRPHPCVPHAARHDSVAVCPARKQHASLVRLGRAQPPRVRPRPARRLPHHHRVVRVLTHRRKSPPVPAERQRPHALLRRLRPLGCAQLAQQLPIVRVPHAHRRPSAQLARGCHPQVLRQRQTHHVVPMAQVELLRVLVRVVDHADARHVVHHLPHHVVPHVAVRLLRLVPIRPLQLQLGRRRRAVRRWRA
mmetsp:Transcript_16031/g.51055  ORF Transcript_16031/g.51055 Transcript_16031/m.51055 type:complete len:513 (+) Transcript_16031:389-1927(+)